VADTAGNPSSRVTALWAVLWLVAVSVIGITASAILYNYQLVDTQPTARLTGMLLIGEVLLYFIVLMVPAEGIVPPGRTLLVVLLAMGGRAAMAMGAAEVGILTGSEAGFEKLWLDFYTGFWLAALVQMLMVALYLWLVRSGLEVSRPEARAPQPQPPAERDYASEFRIPVPPTDQDTRQRQAELLSALMENPEAPVEEADETAEQLPSEPAVEAATPTEEAPASEHEPADDRPAEAVAADTEAVAQAEEPSEIPLGPEPEVTQPEPAQARPDQMAMDLSEAQAAEKAKEEPGESTDSLPPTPAVPADEQEESPRAEVERQPPIAPGAGLSSAQDMALQTAAASVMGSGAVETAVAASGRSYAVVGPTPLPTYPELLTKLDELSSALMAATKAVHSGSFRTLVLMTDEGTLVGAASRDGASQILIRGGAEAKLGQLSLLARRAREAAANLDLGNECRSAAMEPTALPADEAQSRQASERAGQPVAAFTGKAVGVLTTASGADAAVLAGAAECVYQAAAAVAEAMGLGTVERLLVEGEGAGLVVGRCDAARLLVIAAEATAKMGAANVALARLGEALRGEA